MMGTGPRRKPDPQVPKRGMRGSTRLGSARDMRTIPLPSRRTGVGVELTPYRLKFSSLTGIGSPFIHAYCSF